MKALNENDAESITKHGEQKKSADNHAYQSCKKAIGSVKSHYQKGFFSSNEIKRDLYFSKTVHSPYNSFSCDV